MFGKILLIAVIALSAIMLILLAIPKSSDYNLPEEFQEKGKQDSSASPKDNQNIQTQQTTSATQTTTDKTTTSVNEQTSPSSPNCRFQQIPYALKSLIVNQTCNSYSSQNCTEKTVVCTLEVENLDQETSGIFEVNFNFVDSIQQTTVLASEKQEGTINPKSLEKFMVLHSFTYPESNADITCLFNSLQIPKKEVCDNE